MHSAVYEKVLAAAVLLIDGDLVLGLEYARVVGYLDAHAVVDHGEYGGRRNAHLWLLFLVSRDFRTINIWF